MKMRAITCGGLAAGMVLAGTVLAACSDDSTGVDLPSELELSLVSIGGQSLPVELQGPLRRTFTFRSDRIRLRGEDGWVRTRLLTVTDAGAEPVDEELLETGFLTRIDQQTVILDFECDDQVLQICVPPDTLVLTAAGPRINRSFSFLVLEALEFEVVDR